MGYQQKLIKSTLVKKLEEQLVKYDATNFSTQSKLKTAYLVDVMANIRKIKIKENKTFGHLCKSFFNYVFKIGEVTDRIDFVFDSYMEGSIKDSERRRRQTVAAIDLNDIENSTPLPVEMDRFWGSSNNKLKLEILLHTEVLEEERKKSSSVQVIASSFSGTSLMVPCYSVENGLKSEIKELCTDIEEADARLIPHSMHAVKNGVKRLVVMSSDADIFVLLMYYWDILHSKGLLELWLRAGSADSTRHIPIHSLASNIGLDICSVLPALHALTGCDYTSKVGTKAAAVEAYPEKYLKYFGIASIEDVLQDSEAYLVQVLSPKSKKQNKCTTMNELRSQMYYNSKTLSNDQLPPTTKEIHEHIRRAYFVTHQMISLLHPQPMSLEATAYGFEEREELLLPTKVEVPISEEYTIVCNCTKCSSNRCVCRKHGLPCLKFCKCNSFKDDEASPQCKNPSGSIE